MGRPCTICEHADRGKIDSALVAGEPFRALAERTKTKVGSLFRHKTEHLGLVVHRPDQAVPIVSKQLSEQVEHLDESPASIVATNQAPSVTDQARSLCARAISLLSLVEQGIPVLVEGIPLPGVKVIDFKAAANLIGQAKGLLELEAKLVGELQIGATVNILVNPEWQKLRGIIVGALRRHPEAMADVAEAVRLYQGGTTTAAMLPAGSSF